MSIATRSAGVRELRDHLSAHLAVVKNGETIVVTEHGKPVALLSPYRASSRLAALIEQGIAHPPTAPRTRHLPSPVAAAEPVSPIIAEQRQ
ncbi:MAG TPA: type II toxin-antitoxin system prevent-host-death family antitoxin [Arachnia sp.]|nr:type II toxin-antitoxin system prevent-host-death family antitoxin [Arachnia sp.]HMT87593.1 type II toxin-antitoxin system prevent-host-death family antitoxin [Arachnia sp.]